MQLPWSGGVFGGWGVAVEDLLAVGAAGFGGAVGVEDELPASAVDAHVVVVPARQDEVFQGGLAAVFLVAQVADVAVDRGAAAPGPGAFPVPEQNGTADLPRDGVAVADVEGRLGVLQGLSGRPWRRTAATPAGPETSSTARRAIA